jgi:hypothetical protein
LNMVISIIIFGALTLLAGAVILVNPESVFGYLQRKHDRLAILIAAIAVRLVIGRALIPAARCGYNRPTIRGEKYPMFIVQLKSSDNSDKAGQLMDGCLAFPLD